MGGLVLPLVVVLSALTAQSAQTVKVAVVESRHLKPYDLAKDGFREAMAGRGFDVQFIGYTVESDSANGADLAAFVAKNGAQIALALGTDAARVVKDADLKVPSIFSMVSEPGQSGLLNDSPGVGTPMTGVCLDVPVKEQFASLLEVVPEVRRIGVVYSPEESQFIVKEAENTANRMNIGLVTYPVHSEADVPGALNALRPKIDALWLVSDRVVLTTQSLQYVFLFAFQTNLPLMGLSDHFVKMGALVAVGPDYEDVGKQSGELAAQMLAGRNATDLPVASPRKVMLSLNLRTAEIIGLRIPDNIVKRASSLY
ncbi:MAG TPA: ABC transporter substrate-binding protein [bacterium]|nr:ABC transporter substrate-binding protein [bacterium]